MQVPLNIALDEKYEFDENDIMSFQFNKEKTLLDIILLFLYKITYS